MLQLRSMCSKMWDGPRKLSDVGYERDGEENDHAFVVQPSTKGQKIKWKERVEPP